MRELLTENSLSVPVVLSVRSISDSTTTVSNQTYLFFSALLASPPDSDMAAGGGGRDAVVVSNLCTTGGFECHLSSRRVSLADGCGHGKDES